MPTDPAPEKVAALVTALHEARIGAPHDGLWLAGLLLAALNAAGYDVARIEEGERLPRGLEQIAYDALSDYDDLVRDGLADAPTGEAFRLHRDSLLNWFARAALAASDEAAK